MANHPYHLFLRMGYYHRMPVLAVAPMLVPPVARLALLLVVLRPASFPIVEVPLLGSLLQPVRRSRP